MMEFDDVPMALAGEPVEYEEVYRVGPPPPRGLYGAPRPAYLANMPPPQRRSAGGAGSRILPALAVAIPLVAALAPAPRRADARHPRRRGPAVRAVSEGAGEIRTATAPARANSRRAARVLRRTLPLRRAPSVHPPARCAVTPGGNRPPGWGPRVARPAGLPGPPRRGPPARPRRNAGTPRSHPAPSRQTLLLPAVRRQRRAGPPAPGVGRAPGSPAAGWRAASGHCEPDAAGGNWRPLPLPMRQLRTRSAPSSPRQPPRGLGVRPAVRRAADRLPAQPTARRHPARHRSPVRRRRGQRGRRRR